MKIVKIPIVKTSLSAELKKMMTQATAHTAPAREKGGTMVLNVPGVKEVE